ncbi:metallophosphatase domain-containing protein [Chryseobacterium suipulveris]|uniref:Metallophosphatase domain-containing protein n=1 Tax=Chryseobacterium suipulveris TaxID=2929800 RepID=A0ABY4BQP0_9FLAO|nr:metallophosphatase domain-containing protein [Chryseobacterium suipulveris]UOE40126.1 metallophosphatase domain-containing protein [Chryseobacterium suipulveris]
MKFLFISDTHSRHRRLTSLPEADVIIHAGDISKVGKEYEVEDFVDWFSNLNYQHKILIAGNHDFFFERETNENIQHILNDNIIYLHNSQVEIEGIRIWGSPYTPRFFNWAFNLHRGTDLEKNWQQIPIDTDILVTHGPPFGILDRTVSGLNVGCKELMKKVKEVQPKYHLFGHIHEGYGMLQSEKTTFINGSVLNERYELVNSPILFELEK